MSRRLRGIAGVIAAAAFGASAWYLAAAFQWRDAWRILLTASPTWLAVAASTIPVYWLLRAIRWQILLREVGVAVPPVELYTCVAASVGIATVTPFQSGEAMKVEFLKSVGGMGRSRGYSSFLVERVADLGVVVALAASGLLLGCNLGLGRNVVLAVLAGMLLAVLAGIRAAWTLPLHGRLGRFQAHLKACVPNTKAAMVLVGITLTCWGVTGVGWYASLLSLGMDIGYADATTLMCVLALIGVLTFVPGSIGVGEASASLFLVHLGQPLPQAQAGALILRFYGVMIIVLALAHLVIWHWLRGARENHQHLAAPARELRGLAPTDAPADRCDATDKQRSVRVP
jgi:glycosyltransferase 2 family protein